MITAKIKIKLDRSATKRVLKKLDQGMDDLIDLGFAVSQESVPVDQGLLKKSGAVEREFLNKKIIYASPIALYIEYGTRAHWPPIEPLVDWAHRVLGLPYARKRTERKKGFRAGKQIGFGEAAKMREGSAEQVGFLIAKKISEEGTEPQPYLRPALDELRARAVEILRRRFER